MRASEVIRIIAFSIIGWLAMFLGQPWIYRSRFPVVRLTDVRNIESWISNYYTTGASIVFFVSVISTVIWYGMAAKAQSKGGEDVAKWPLVWVIISIIPILGIVIAIGFFRGSDQAFLSLTTFFVIDVLFLYWFTTATSSPGGFKYVPPGAFLIRRLFGN